MGEDIKTTNQNIKYLESNINKMRSLWSLQEVNISKSNVIKRFIRKSIYWFIRPLVDQQVEFNRHMLAAIEDIYRLECKSGRCDNGSILSSEILPESENVRIIQLVSTLNYGDAIGNEVQAIKRILQDMGVVTQTFVSYMGKNIGPTDAYFEEDMPELKKSDIVIYHFSSECKMVDKVKKLPCKVYLRYHNITPPDFFKGYDDNAYKSTKIGLEQLLELKDHIHEVLAVSEFNKSDLIAMGYTCPIRVIPILIRFSDYKKNHNQEVVKKYKDGTYNIMFLGRMAPNKKIEDVIEAYNYYNKNVNKNSRLILVGSYNEDDKYYKFLKKKIYHDKVENVVFSGHIPFSEIIAFYRVADVFLCLSEHEGFCVPLVEAMYFSVPIVAYNSSAIGDTLGGSGILLDSKDNKIIADILEKIRTYKEYKDKILLAERNRLEDFYEVKDDWWKWFNQKLVKKVKI